MNKPKWYRYDQNNSGGFFVVNSEVCEEVFFQAYSQEQADMLAHGVLDSYSAYCECCGERWYYGCSEVGDEPTIYGEKIHEVEKGHYRTEARFHYLDGRVVAYQFGSGIHFEE